MKAGLFLEKVRVTMANGKGRNLKINDEIVIYLKKKRNLPALLTAMEPYKKMQLNVFGKREPAFLGDTTS